MNISLWMNYDLYDQTYNWYDFDGKPRFPFLRSHHQSCCACQQGTCRQRPAASAGSDSPLSSTLHPPPPRQICLHFSQIFGSACLPVWSKSEEEKMDIPKSNNPRAIVGMHWKCDLKRDRVEKGSNCALEKGWICSLRSSPVILKPILLIPSPPKI